MLDDGPPAFLTGKLPLELSTADALTVVQALNEAVWQIVKDCDHEGCSERFFYEHKTRVGGRSASAVVCATVSAELESFRFACCVASWHLQPAAMWESKPCWLLSATGETWVVLLLSWWFAHDLSSLCVLEKTGALDVRGMVHMCTREICKRQ